MFYKIISGTVLINTLLAGGGGALGSSVRYLFSVMIKYHYTTPNHYATFVVNVLGSFIIGFASTAVPSTTGHWHFFAVGFCGGFTTFSSFAFENVSLIKDGKIETAIAYIFLSIAVCLAATLAGIFSGELLKKNF